jgi:hypothetical protein
MVVSNKIDAQIQALKRWHYEKANEYRDNNKNPEEVFGPMLYDPAGWEALMKKQLDIKVVNRGVMDLAPHLDSQTKFVLNSLDRGLDDIRSDIENLYEDFKNFASTLGPAMGLNSLNSNNLTKKIKTLREDYLDLLMNVTQHSTSLYTSKGLIRNAAVTIKMQSKIADSVNAGGGKMSSRYTYETLSHTLTKLVDIVDDLGMALQDLQSSMKAVKGTPSKVYPRMDTKQGKNQRVDKVYYVVLTEWLRVLAHCHKVENAVRNFSSQLEKVDSMKSIVSTHKTALDTLPGILSTYKSIDSKAKTIFPKYKPMRSEPIARFTEAMDKATGREKKRLTLVETNKKLLSRLEEIF